jgi:XTP/dITP diphosphohydrolase
MTREPRLRIALATSNRGKLAELTALFGDLPVELVSVRDVLGHELEVEEDGATFEANAEKKARAVSEQTGLVALADDSGLEVDALEGRPGVRSARFAHERATDGENNAALLRALAETRDEDRTARFRCVLALVTPWDGRARFTSGACEGRIGREPRGAHGFGYDPLFLPDEAPQRTMAELSPPEKNRISHRWRAARALVPALEALTMR